MAIPISIYKLELEMDRRCVSNCKMCMRGKPQKYCLTADIIDNIMKNEDHEVTTIHTVFLTGGEVMRNKEGMIYFLKYLIEHNIEVYKIHMVINSLIYEQEIMNLLEILDRKGVEISIRSFIDQYHKEVPQENIERFKEYAFYKYQEGDLSEQEIVKIGKAKENDIGSEVLAKRMIIAFNQEAKGHINLIRLGESILIESLYVTARGKFGSTPPDATWDMIDNRYYLDITNDSIFTNCEVSGIFSGMENLLQNSSILGEQFQNDLKLAQENDILDIFFSDLSTEKIRDYLVNNSKKSFTRTYEIKR